MVAKILQDHTIYTRLEEFHGLDLVHAHFQQHVFPRHCHETFVIEVVEQGIDKFYCGGKLYRAEAGQIVIIQPGEIHTGESEGEQPLVYRSFYPDGELIDDLADALGLDTAKLSFNEHVIDDPELAGKISEAHRSCESHHDSLEWQQALTEALSMLVLRHATKPTDDHGPDIKAPLLRVQNYIQENFYRPLTLDELAAVAGLSTFHLIRRFKREIGITPYEYLMNVRIEAAKKLLAAGMPVSQVALDAGFYDQSHLNRHFRRILGFPPGKYRAAHLE